MAVAHMKKKLTNRGRRHLERRAPKLVENDKQLLLLRTRTANASVVAFLRQMAALKQPLCRLFDNRHSAATDQQQQQMLPFDNALPLERLCAKLDTSLFVVGSHSRKRPDNIVLGRTHDGQVLDMFEFGLAAPPVAGGAPSRSAWQPMPAGVAVPAATKPALLFCGERWQREPLHRQLMSVLLDVFGGVRAEAVRLTGLQLVLLFVAPDRADPATSSTGAAEAAADAGGGDTGNANDVIYWRTYRATVAMRHSADGVAAAPAAAAAAAARVQLVETGPSATLQLRRFRLAPAHMLRRALRQPKQVTSQRRPRKNVTNDKLGAQLGRVHMVPQDLTRLATKKMKGLKTTAAKTDKAKPPVETPNTTDGKE